MRSVVTSGTTVIRIELTHNVPTGSDTPRRAVASVGRIALRTAPMVNPMRSAETARIPSALDVLDAGAFTRQG